MLEWAFMLPFLLIVLAIWVWLMLHNVDRCQQRERRLVEGRCPSCGHDLRGVRDSACPECGTHRPVA